MNHSIYSRLEEEIERLDDHDVFRLSENISTTYSDSKDKNVYATPQGQDYTNFNRVILSSLVIGSLMLYALKNEFETTSRIWRVREAEKIGITSTYDQPKTVMTPSADQSAKTSSHHLGMIAGKEHDSNITDSTSLADENSFQSQSSIHSKASDLTLPGRPGLAKPPIQIRSRSQKSYSNSSFSNGNLENTPTIGYPQFANVSSERINPSGGLDPDKGERINPSGGLSPDKGERINPSGGLSPDEAKRVNPNKGMYLPPGREIDPASDSTDVRTDQTGHTPSFHGREVDPSGEPTKTGTKSPPMTEEIVPDRGSGLFDPDYQGPGREVDPSGEPTKTETKSPPMTEEIVPDRGSGLFDPDYQGPGREVDPAGDDISTSARINPDLPALESEEPTVASTRSYNKANLQKDAARYFADGESHYRSGKFNEALSDFLKATELEPSNNHYIARMRLCLGKTKEESSPSPITPTSKDPDKINFNMSLEQILRELNESSMLRNSLRGIAYQKAALAKIAERNNDREQMDYERQEAEKWVSGKFSDQDKVDLIQRKDPDATYIEADSRYGKILRKYYPNPTKQDVLKENENMLIRQLHLEARKLGYDINEMFRRPY